MQISEERRKEIIQKLKQERNVRKKQIDSKQTQGKNNNVGPENFNCTFNKQTNHILQQQMLLSKQEIEQNQQYLNREMQEQDKESDEDDEDDNFNNKQNIYKFTEQDMMNYKNNKLSQNHQNMSQNAEEQEEFKENMHSDYNSNQQDLNSNNQEELNYQDNNEQIYQQQKQYYQNQYCLNDENNQNFYNNQLRKPFISERLNLLAQKKQNNDYHSQCKQVHIQNQKKPIIMDEEEKKKIWNRLQYDRKEVYDQREELKNLIKESDFQQNCTFNPKLNQKSYQITNQKQEETNNIPVQERLANEAKLAKEKIQLKIQEKDAKELEQCSFHPQIYSQQITSNPPIYERYAEIQKKKQEIYYKYENCTFQPQINQNSQLIAEIKINNKDVCSRLNQEYEQQMIRKATLQTIVEQNKYKDCVFQPKINENTEQVLANKKQQNNSFKYKNNYVDENCTFKPKINEISEFILEMNTNRIQESMQQKVDRLSKYDIAERKQKIQKIQSEIDQYNVFQPKINEISKILTEGRPKDLDQLAFNYIGKEHIRKLQLEKESEEFQECSFYPKTSLNYKNISAKYNQEHCEQNVKIEQQLKERKRRQQKKQYMEKEMKECSFKPSINQKSYIDNKSVIQYVKGMDNYLENIDKSEKIKQNLKLKQEQLFNIHKKYDVNNRPKSTQQMPFKLSYETRYNYVQQ